MHWEIGMGYTFTDLYFFHKSFKWNELGSYYFLAMKSSGS